MKIDPDATYTLIDITVMGVMGNSHHTVAANIWRDKYAKDILQTTITGQGKGVRYKIKGSNLLKYIKEHGKN